MDMKKILWYAVLGVFKHEETLRERQRVNPCEENARLGNEAIKDELALTELYRKEVGL